jgi:hypothetical protein
LNVCAPWASPEYDAGLAQLVYPPPSSWQLYPLPLPPPKLKLAVVLALGLGGLALIVGAASTVTDALVLLEVHEW